MILGVPNFVATVVGEDWASALAPFGEPPAGSAAEVEARWSWWCVIFALEAPFEVREGVPLARPEPWRSELSDYQPTADYLWGAGSRRRPHRAANVALRRASLGHRQQVE
jgi:hypothetical protein